MLVRAYGLMWRREEINWSKTKHRLLGRRGHYAQTLWLADFENQRGIYILYDEFAHYYIGLARDQGIGKRLHQHLDEKWDRFCWFGFKRVLKKRVAGVHLLSRSLAQHAFTNPYSAIKDFEAILVKCFVWVNEKTSDFDQAAEWFQVRLAEKEKYLNRASHS